VLIKKEAVMTYGMFTEIGNQAVQRIVDYAKGKLMTYNETLPLLYALSQKAGFEEATDTAVRECVYTELNM
jgi:hypothetical protein